MSLPLRRSFVLPAVAQRLERLPAYLFVQLDGLKQAMIRSGQQVIDMGVGDPDQPTPSFILQAMIRALRDSGNHRYPSHRGLPALRQAIAQWYRQRFGVHLDPDTEVLPLIGSKEGIAHLPLAYVNPGDTVWIPDPGYPPYRSGTILAGGRPVEIPLLAENQFLPDLEALKRLRTRPKLFFLNYPNNPTGAVAHLEFFRALVDWAHRNGVPICHDNAYSELAYDGMKPPSFLEVPGAKEVGIEFHSLSKTFNMTGWRIGWVCGNRRMISALAQIKSHIDSGIFQAIQWAGIAALQSGSHHLGKMLSIYERRRDLLVNALKKAHAKVDPPQATFYLWVPTPRGQSSRRTAAILLRQSGIVATPGVGFGRFGEGYIRLAFSVPNPLLKEAARRIEGLKLWPPHSSH
jgi:LL-diaminopimelate aminotransferase